MKPWCAEGEVASAANLNLYRGRTSHVGWHSDDEPLFGEQDSLSRWALGPKRSSNGRASPVRTVKLARAVLVMVTFSWMANLRTSFFTVLILAWNTNGLTSRSVGSGNRSGVLFADVCAGFVCSWYGDGGERLFVGFLVSSQRLVHMGGTSIASLLPRMCRAWVTEVCLLLDTSLGRRSVGAISL